MVLLLRLTPTDIVITHARVPILEHRQMTSAFITGSMPFCVELDNLKDTDAPIHQPAAMLVAAD
jgi:hypothetical protein